MKLGSVLVGSLATVAVMGAASFAPIQTQDSKSKPLDKYLVPRVVTELEWELVQANLWWEGAFDYSTDYITSHPIGFDRSAGRFRTAFRVSERRDLNDARPFSSLSKAERASILQGGVDAVVGYLSSPFPEIKSIPSLLYVEFSYRARGGGFTKIAAWENGRLVFLE